MAISNRDRVGQALDLLAEGLFDVVDEVMTRVFQSNSWTDKWAEKDALKYGSSKRTISKSDVQVQLRALTEYGWEFKEVLSRAQQGFASELRETRNLWAHNEPFSSDDAFRALDTIARLLQAVDSVDSAKDVLKLRDDLQRNVYEDRARHQAKRANVVKLEPGAGLKPWREVIEPHDDVARGEFTASEFAADLHLVHTKQALSPEYGDPVEFFSRTYLTEGLRDLLSRALRRLNGDANASPVVNLQTNFGGGKTHSMLALYHLFSGVPAQRFPQEVQELVHGSGVKGLEKLGVRRAALVGTYLQAGSPSIKEDGTEVRTMWGELAWQLGGRAGYDIVAEADKTGTNPGEALYTLLSTYGPALILVDEWVAYARQLISDKELPAGSFDTQFTFAQSLTEMVSSIPGTMLVVSIPASDGSAQAGTDIEIGGEKGQRALERLQNVIRRVADQWRPSTRDESFEIVRRRLFKTPDAESLAMIAAVSRSFVTMYRENLSAFPRDAVTASNEYETRIRASYPLHPELLDRLYEDWSTLERFQRTRGVLKLVSAIIHELWASNDTSPLILPGNVPLSAASVNTDFTQYLEDAWKPIIDSDIDGPDCTASRIDKEKPALGKRHITQRIARTIFVGAAPRNNTNRKGLDKQYLWLGTAIPGDVLGNFSSAIENLSQRSTYFYEEQGHYWFDTQPSVSKTARDHAERLREEPETVWNEIIRRLQSEDSNRGVFDRVHIAPLNSGEIPDFEETRLVIMHPKFTWGKTTSAGSTTYDWVYSAIENKGGSQRVHRNALIFLSVDDAELSGLEAAARSYLGWKLVHDGAEEFNLTAQQRRQAEDWVKKCDQTVGDRIRSAYTRVLIPEQEDPTQPFDIWCEKISDSGDMSFAVRIGDKLDRSGHIVPELASSVLAATINEKLGNWWSERDHVYVGELWEYFTRFIYLYRLVRRSVLDNAVMQAATSIMVGDERFAIAHSIDEDTGRYRGLIIPPNNEAQLIHVTDSTLIVKWEKAVAQQEEDRIAREKETLLTASLNADVLTGAATDGEKVGAIPPVLGGGEVSIASDSSQVEAVMRDTIVRYFGSVKIDPERYSRDLGQITREIIDRLVGAGAKLTISLDIQAEKPEGFNEAEIRTIKENSNALKFENSGFEKG